MDPFNEVLLSYLRLILLSYLYESILAFGSSFILHDLLKTPRLTKRLLREWFALGGSALVFALTAGISFEQVILIPSSKPEVDWLILLDAAFISLSGYLLTLLTIRLADRWDKRKNAKV